MFCILFKREGLQNWINFRLLYHWVCPSNGFSLAGDYYYVGSTEQWKERREFITGLGADFLVCKSGIIVYCHAKAWQGTWRAPGGAQMEAGEIGVCVRGWGGKGWGGRGLSCLLSYLRQLSSMLSSHGNLEAVSSLLSSRAPKGTLGAELPWLWGPDWGSSRISFCFLTGSFEPICLVLIQL